MGHPVQPSFHPHEQITAGVRRIARQLVDGALDPIARPTQDPDEDIHRIRTSIKRLRAFLLLIRPSIAEETYERENARLQRAARRLAFSRDIAVVRKTLLALAHSATGRRNRKAFAQVLKGLHRAVAVAVAKPADRRNALREVAAALRQSATAIPRLRLRAREWDAVGPGLEAVSRAGRQQMKRAFIKDDDAGFHRWRIRVKSLFYQLEMLAPAWPARLCETLARLNDLQDCVGADHDLAVVKSILDNAPDAFGGACAIRRVIACIERRQRRLRKAGRKLGQAIYDQKPGRFIGEVKKHWYKWREPGKRAPASA